MIWHQSDTLDTYIYNGSEWVAMSPVSYAGQHEGEITFSVDGGTPVMAVVTDLYGDGSNVNGVAISEDLYIGRHGFFEQDVEVRDDLKVYEDIRMYEDKPVAHLNKDLGTETRCRIFRSDRPPEGTEGFEEGDFYFEI